MLAATRKVGAVGRVDRQRGLVIVTLILGLDQVVKAAVAASNGVERGFSPDRAFVPVVLLVVVAGAFVELTRRRLVGVAAVGLVAGGLASRVIDLFAASQPSVLPAGASIADIAVICGLVAGALGMTTSSHAPGRRPHFIV